MKQTVNIKYGSVVKAVELPICFSAASLEECIQTVLHCQQKPIFGLRYANTMHIYPLEDIHSADELIEIANQRSEPLILVFHSILWRTGVSL